MVFESAVTEILNKVLGDYVLNLDKKQLKIGIWGGDVELHNLKLRENALDDLNLPVQLTHGYLGKLVLKIPWKNLYSQPVVVQIEDFYAIVTPKQSVQYDAEKEAKFELQGKQSALQKIEDVRKKEMEKDKTKTDQSFTEKLTAQIVNNLQVRIMNVHLRYEDTVTAGLPFSFGVTLHELDIYTTDANWSKSYITEQISRVFKIASLDCLSIYMNIGDEVYNSRTKDLKELLKTNIAEKLQTLNNSYIFGPISSMAKLQLNMNPEQDVPAFVIPKIDFDVDIDNLNIGITRKQFQTLLRLGDSVNRMQLGIPYRRYRPFNTPFKGHYKEWWKFAITAVLEEDVRRRRRNWSWDNIKEHRQHCITYAQAFKDLQLCKKSSANLVETVNLCEQKLDLFNLILIRNRVHLEVEKIKQEEEQKSNQNKGWFGWFSRSNTTSDENSGDIFKKFEAAMTSEEKEKLCTAIGYQENATDTTLPETYEAVKMNFRLKALRIGVYDDIPSDAHTDAHSDVKSIMFLQFSLASCKFSQRPAANALKVVAGMKEMKLTGVRCGNSDPTLVESIVHSENNLLDIFFETNPTDGMCDQRIKLSARPLQIVYDYATVKELMGIFAPPTSVNLSELEEAASQRFLDFKERSATGMQYMVEKHAVLDVDIELMPNLLIIPRNGIFDINNSMIVLSLGELRIKSEPRKRHNDVSKMLVAGYNQDDILKNMMDSAYDRFMVSIENVQILIVRPNENWREELLRPKSELQILRPTSLSINVNVCVIENDPRLPKSKVSILLPAIYIGITEERLLEGYTLFKSLPLPGGDDDVQSTPLSKVTQTASRLSIIRLIDQERANTKAKLAKMENALPSEMVEYTNLEMCFVLNEIGIVLFKSKTKQTYRDDSPSDSYGTPIGEMERRLDVEDLDISDGGIDGDQILALQVLKIEVNVSKRFFDLSAVVKLGAINLTQYNDNEMHTIIETPGFNSGLQYLLNINYHMVDKKSPEFITKYASTEQCISVDFSALSVVLHQQCLLNLFEMANNLQQKLDRINEILVQNNDRIATILTSEDVLKSPSSSNRLRSIAEMKQEKARRKNVSSDIVNIKFNANMDQVAVEIIGLKRPLASLKIQKLFAGVCLKESSTELILGLKDISVLDLNPESVHSTILSIVGKDALSCKVIMFNNDEISTYNSYDIQINVTLGCIKIVFVNFFCMSLLDFMNNFQTVQKAIADASAAAADATKQNVVEVYKKATKMKFNVQVKAPIVIVPIDSKSTECVVIDLGYLHISNNCTDVQVEEDERSPAVIDDIKVDLMNMKMSSATILKSSASGDISLISPDDSMTNAIGIGSHSNIFDPISFNLLVQRNLSSGWYKKKPDLNVSGHLDSIKINLTTNDYKLLMTILNKNLTEGLDEFQVASNEEHLITKTNTEVVTVETHKPSVSKITTDQSMPAETPTVFEQLKFNFQFDGVVLNLFTADGEELSTFGFYFLSLKGKKYDDGTLSTSLVLCDIQLDDKRSSSKSKITKFLCRKESRSISNELISFDDSTPKPTNYMLDVTVLLKENDSFAEVRVCGFDLILSIDFMLKIAEFFSSPQQPAESVTASRFDEKAVARNKIKKSNESTQSTLESYNKMKLVLHIEEPDIILVDNLDDINAHAIIFNAQVNVTYRAIGEKQIIHGEITELRMYMCSFMPEKRDATKHFIIHPCMISLQGSTPENHGLHIFLKLSDILINISPATIELINKAITTVSSSAETNNIISEDEESYDNIWSIQPFEESDFWFMKCERAMDALEMVELEVTQELSRKPEKCVIEVPSIILVFESGVGYYTSPMLFIETKMAAQVSDWSHQMKVDGNFSLSMQYFNTSQAIWEPLIEPNEKIGKNGESCYEPWELNFTLDINPKANECNDTDSDFYEPSTKIKIYSEKILELTMSKTCYELLQDLGEAFSQAIDSKGLVKPDVVAPYVIENDTGFDLHIDFTKSHFTLHDCHTPNNKTTDVLNRSLLLERASASQSFQIHDIKNCTISDGGKAYLQTKPFSDVPEEELDGIMKSENTVFIKIGGIEKELALPVSKSDQRYFCLNRDVNHDPWGVVSEVVSQYGTTKINVHSVVKIHNHFTTKLSVFRMNPKKNEKILVGEISPGDLYNVPLHSIYTDLKELYFSLPGYNCSVQGIKWNDSPTDASYSRQIQCDPVGTFEPLYINAVREKTEIFYENTSKHTILSSYYTIHLRPSLYLRNALPIDICISVAGCSVRNDCITKGLEVEENGNKSIIKEDLLDYGEKNVCPGDVLQLPIVKVAKRPQDSKSYLVIRLVDYLEKHWSCTTEISEDHNEFETWTFSSYDSVEKMDMDLGIRFEDRHGSLMLTIFSPFWMINKTGLMLSYKANTESSNVLYHPPDYNGPILFSFREKNFFGKKRAHIRVDNGSWSEKIPLDVAGSAGQVSCKSNDVSYQIGVHNHFTSNSLTKQITFIPMYTIVNNCSFAVEVQDACRPADAWIKIQPNQCAPLWPVGEDAQNLLIARVVGDPQTTIPFKYTEAQCTLLKLANNKVGGINVDVQITEGGIYVTLTPYHHGDPPGLIINNTRGSITFREKGNPNECTLQCNEKLLFTWTDNTKEKLLIFNNNEKLVSDLRRDHIGVFDECEQIYWVSFLDGLQRVLLITYSEEVARNGESSTNLQKINEEIEISIFGIGFSLVNNVTGTDILYVGITSSGVIWESKKLDKRRYKQMKIAQTDILEGRYQQYLCDKQVGARNTYYLDSAKTEIDFDQMILRKSPHRNIRRTFYPGMWILLKTSPYQSQIHAKINRIQIDNQLADCVFPVVLAPVPPPKSVADTTELKPFVECSIVQRVVPNSTVKQFKYCSILVQEFDIKVDLLFVTAIADIFAYEMNDEQSAKLFNNDVESIKSPLSSLVSTHSQLEQKNFYDNLHLGPLKMHLSFSMAGSETKALPGILSVIVQSVGVTLTDVNDVVFKLGFFEREFQFFTQKDLVSEISSHYAGQALKQLYVLVLGLDILGNPYGLVVGITKGVEDLFYEPFQGLIQGPGEFAEGLVLGVKSLFGHTVGGAAGAVSKITGAMGKCLAVLTFDEDYQKKRRQAINRKPTTFNEGIARSGKGLVMGVVDGVTGVFTKPISGAKEEGVQGFFKGMGRGAIGLIARPTAGVVDFTSGSLEAVKRATEDGEDTLRLRPPRFFSSDNILKPYSYRDAQGNKLLKEIEKGKYAKTDIFSHSEEVIEKHEVLLLSNNRVIYAAKNDIFGHWNIKWTYRWSEIQAVTSSDRGVIITLKKESTKLMGLFSSSEENRKIIHIPWKSKRDKLIDIMENLRKPI